MGKVYLKRPLNVMGQDVPQSKEEFDQAVAEIAFLATKEVMNEAMQNIALLDPETAELVDVVNTVNDLITALKFTPPSP